MQLGLVSSFKHLLTYTKMITPGYPMSDDNQEKRGFTVLGEKQLGSRRREL